MSSEGSSFSFARFENHISETLDESFLFSRFTDVTLVSEDNKHFSAHKMVLCASSPVFSDVLQNHPRQETFIYFQEVENKVLQALLDYMYQGSVDISRHILDDFMSFAEQMKVKDLSKNEGINCNIEYDIEDLSMGNSANDIKHHEIDLRWENGDSNEATQCNEPKDSMNYYEIKKDTEFVVEGPLKDNSANKIKDGETELDRQNQQDEQTESVNGHIDPVEKVKGCIKLYQCDDCHREFKDKYGLKGHIKRIHEGVRYKCMDCNYLAITRSKLQNHVRNVHEGVTFPCDECGFKYSDSTTLKMHVRRTHKEEEKTTCDQCDHISKTKKAHKLHTRAKHETVKFNCEQCEYVTGWAGYLKTHIKSKHEGNMQTYNCEVCGRIFNSKDYLTKHMEAEHSGIRYSCDKCSYKAKLKIYLKQHTQNKHEGIQHYCSQCEYKTGRLDNLITHQKVKHEGQRIPCDECDYHATRPDYLKIHKNTKHNNVLQ